MSSAGGSESNTVAAARRAKEALGRGVRAARQTTPVRAAPQPDGALIQRLAERDVHPEPRMNQSGALKRELAALITPAEQEELLGELDEPMREALAAHDAVNRAVILIGIAIGQGRFDLEARTGLTATWPPEDVHAMSHGPNVLFGGDPGYADLIDTAFTEAGLPLAGGARVLDFGCSSGRIVRMLAARRPEAKWSGCDVNDGAIAWATEHLPSIDFANQPLRPPLPYADASFDGVFAISIWSHFDQAPARAWLDELHRIIRPGGVALITTHGPGAIAFRSAVPGHGEEAQRALLVDLYRSGFSFVDAFGPGGDWGVVDREWGVSFMSPEWLLTATTPEWSCALYRPAAIEGHQDLWMLRREDRAAIVKRT